jgi:hypothetical protein
MRHPWPLLVLAAALVACSEKSADPVVPRLSRLFVRDPIGDTMASPHAVARAHDVLSIATTPRGDTLLVSVRFADSVQPFSSGVRNAVLGIMDFDVDDDSSTGVPAVADGFGATAGIGAEWSLFLQDSAVTARDQRVALLDLATDEVHWIPGHFDGTLVTAHVPRALLGAGARLRMVGVFGSIERASDVVPNEGSVPIVLP